MSVGIFGRIGGRAGAPGSKLVFSESVAVEKYYVEYWEKAIKDTDARIFHESGSFGKDKLDAVLDELKRIDKWVGENVKKHNTFGDFDEEYMHEHIERLLETIPQIFEEYEDITLEIF